MKTISYMQAKLQKHLNPVQRPAFAVCAFTSVLLCFAAGCSESPRPLAEGEIIQCIIAPRTDHPTPNTTVTQGGGVFSKGRVSVHPSFIIIRDEGGKGSLHPIERVVQLEFRSTR